LAIDKNLLHKNLDQIVNGNILCINTKSSLTIRFHEPPVELFPYHFIEYLINFSAGEMSPLLDYNLGNQEVYQSRTYEIVKKLGYAI
jgi:hypothetical protein